MVAIKVIYNSSARYFETPTSTTWFEFERKIRSLFSIPTSTPIAIAYTDDDGDIVTLSSDLELGEVLSGVSGRDLSFTLFMNGDDNKNSWVLEGDATEPYRIAEENNIIKEDLPVDQTSGESRKKEEEQPKEPTVETQTNSKSSTFHLHTTVTDETDQPSFEPTITNRKQEETQSRNELSDAPSTSSSSATIEKTRVGIGSSASTLEEAKNQKKAPETAEDVTVTDLWEELLKSVLENEGRPRRETPPENLGGSSNANSRLVVRVSPPQISRRTYGPRVTGIGNPRSFSSFTQSCPRQNHCATRTTLLNNTRQHCGCSSNNCGCTSFSRQRQTQCDYRDPLSKLIIYSISTIVFLSAIIVVAKAAVFILSLLFPIVLFIFPILFLLTLHNNVRCEHLGGSRDGHWNHGPRISSRPVLFVRPSLGNHVNVQFLRRRHGHEMF